MFFCVWFGVLLARASSLFNFVLLFRVFMSSCGGWVLLISHVVFVFSCASNLCMLHVLICFDVGVGDWFVGASFVSVCAPTFVCHGKRVDPCAMAACHCAMCCGVDAR